MAKFEWQTEDEYGWEDEPQSAGNSPRPRRRSLMLLLFIGIVAIAGFIFYHQLQNTVTDATADVETEVATTVALFNSAGHKQDVNLLTAMLSGSDETWAQSWQVRAFEDSLLDRSGLGMTLISAEPAATNVVLSPDLNSAEITATIPYAIDIGNGLTTTVLLDQPALYRRGQTRWLRAPRDVAEWGDQRVREASFGLATYYARDEVVIDRLLSDIGLFYQRVCASASTALCGLNGIRVRFEADYINPKTVSLSDRLPLLSLTDSAELHLPTPSLVGLPTDDTSYDALLAGYARLIAGKALAHSMQQQPVCCDQWLYFEALVEHLLVEHGLSASNINGGSYAAARSTATLSDFSFRYDNPSRFDINQRTSAYIFVTYMRETFPNMNTADLLLQLRENPEGIDWLLHIGYAEEAESLHPVEWAELLFENYRTYLDNRIPNEA